MRTLLKFKPAKKRNHNWDIWTKKSKNMWIECFNHVINEMKMEMRFCFILQFKRWVPATRSTFNGSVNTGMYTRNQEKRWKTKNWLLKNHSNERVSHRDKQNFHKSLLKHIIFIVRILLSCSYQTSSGEEENCWNENFAFTPVRFGNLVHFWMFVVHHFFLQ